VTVYTLKVEADLETMLSEHDTLVLDFWAVWCPPCREFAPLFERAAERHPALAFCRVNSDEAKSLARAFNVKSIPTLLVIKERILIVEQPGYLTESAFEDLLQQTYALDMEELRREMAAATGESEEQE
jgi:thioredoxin 1